MADTDRLNPKSIISIVFVLVLLLFIGWQAWQAYQQKSVEPFKVTPIIFLVMVFLLFILSARVLDVKFDIKTDYAMVLLVLAIIIGIFLVFSGFLPEPFRAPVLEIGSIIGIP